MQAQGEPLTKGVRYMSIQALSWAFELEGLSSSQKVTLFALANYANHDNEAWPNVSSLAKKCGLTSRSIFNCIKSLQEIGLINIINQTHKNGRKRSNRYILNVHVLSIHITGQSEYRMTDSNTHDTHLEVKEFQVRGERDSGRKVKEIHISKENRHVEPTKEHSLSISAKPTVDNFSKMKEIEKQIADDLIDYEQIPNRSVTDQALFVLAFLNYQAGKKHRPVKANMRFIEGRLREGYTIFDMISVICNRTLEWKTDQTMYLFLRPETLFNATKFSGYVGNLGTKPKAGGNGHAR